MINDEKDSDNLKARSDETAASFARAAEGAADFPATAEENKKGVWYRFIKRAFDIASSGLMILVLSPFMALALIIKFVEDFNKKYCKLEITETDVPDGAKAKKRVFRGKDGKYYECRVVKDPEKKNKGKRAPVYSSIRVGNGGKKFKFYKIRSMYPGAENMKQQLVDAGLNEADGPVFKIKYDPRITTFGRFLRKTGFDELMQLFNIFKGDMSVVGPRPPLPDEVERYTPYQRRRLDIRGGLLCLWQIQKNRNSLSFDDWVRLDIEYIEKRSVGLDIKIIFKGAYGVFFDRSGE